MTLTQALATGLGIYSSYQDATLRIDPSGWLDVMRLLPNGKTECSWYRFYQTARSDYPLDSLDWHVKEWDTK